ncbi:ABC transporter ATP-binding protein [Methylobacterium sp. E-045]|uniref:ABC transporter ATP-binding protein n=1 Tax=Methylobacterium sp. E-045 TaxID=2836575 RepID=UPI001FB8A76F|nr:ATP-binding cassette domain-containing protein [Methylobacterium sp. E-045]MCJ2129806.1 ATP-binding cassette domain-containing protein [Methylobacterium sp. E-045]
MPHAPELPADESTTLARGSAEGREAGAPSWWRDLTGRIEPRLRGRYRVGLALLAADAGLAALPLLTAAWVIGDRAVGTWESGKAWIAGANVVGAFLARLAVMPVGFARGFESGYRAVAELRLAVFAHLRRLGLGALSRIGAASLSDLVTHRFRWIEEEAGYGLGRQIGHAALALVLILALASIHLAFLAAVAALAGLSALAYRRLDGTFARLAHDQANLVAESAERMVEYLAGLPVLRALGQVGARASAYRRQVEALHAFYRGTIGTVAPLVSATRILLDLALLVLIGVAVALFALGAIGAPGLAVALVLVLLLLTPLEASIGEGFMLRLVGDAHARAAVILARPALGEGTETPRSGEIRFESVRFGYDGGNPVLDGFDLVLPHGRVTAVIGPSGAGKSTLLSLLARAFDVEAGRITIGGQDIRAVPLDRHLARLGVVPQDVFLFADTFSGNLRLAKPEATEAECRAAADRARCAGFIAQLPEGVETRLGEGGRDLSGGERQRVAIARAMLKDAEIVLLDEATSALDAESEHGVGEGLRTLFQGRTVVMIAHRLQTVAQADHIVVMEAGRVVDNGEPAELEARCPLYRDLWSAYRDTERWRLSDTSSAPALAER